LNGLKEHHGDVEKITDVETHHGNNYGYIRIRMILSNGDFLEVAEYFVIQDGKICVSRYRYQWMNPTQQVLKKRWDNTKHFNELYNFPHHIHIDSETYVVPGWELSIIELLDLLEKDINNIKDVILSEEKDQSEKS